MNSILMSGVVEILIVVVRVVKMLFVDVSLCFRVSVVVSRSVMSRLLM